MQYRYDALGRRVWVHGKQECDAVPAGYPEPAGGLALQCRLGYMRRTVWDGNQELAEVQAPGAPANAALWEQDVGYYAALPLDVRSSPPIVWDTAKDDIPVVRDALASALRRLG